MSKGHRLSKEKITTHLKEIPLYHILKDSSNYFVHHNFVVENVY